MRTSRGRLCTESCSSDVVDQHLRIGVADDEGDDALAQVVVGHPDHRDLRDARVAEQHGLDLARADAVAAGLDQVDRLASDDAVHAVAVDHRDVAGAVPAVGVERLGGGIRPVQIAVEQHRPSNFKSPNGFPVVGDLGAVVVDQPGLHSRQRQPDPAGPCARRRPGC